MNPVAVREDYYRCVPPVAARKKKVVVVGGGPAGMEAALVASSRGHDVTLFEKEDRLGGNLLAAAGPDFKADWKRYRRLPSAADGRRRAWTSDWAPRPRPTG